MDNFSLTKRVCQPQFFYVLVAPLGLCPGRRWRTSVLQILCHSPSQTKILHLPLKTALLLLLRSTSP